MKLRYGIEKKAIAIQIVLSLIVYLLGINPNSIDVIGFSEFIPGIKKFASFSAAKHEIYIIQVIGWHALTLYIPILFFSSKPFNLNMEYRHPVLSLIGLSLFAIGLIFWLYFGIESSASSVGPRLALLRDSALAGILIMYMLFYVVYFLLNTVFSTFKSFLNKDNFSWA